MAIINMAAREITCKIVYYGTGLGGKTANLKYIFSQLSPSTRGELIMLNTETERTLFFDFLGLELGTVQGFATKFSLYTVPGQVEYNASRKLLLNGVDGVIFVADSDRIRRRENVECYNNMLENLAAYDLNQHSVSMVMQYNKRDLSGAMDLNTMENDLNPYSVPSFEAVALDGSGVFATLKAVSKQVLNRLQ